MACAGFQKETWNFLKTSGPLISKAIHDCYRKRLVAGLLSPRRVDVQPSSVSPGRMRDLTARVTSSLLRFPEATLQAVGEDERTADSRLCGKFSGGRNGLAWLACGPQLEVVKAVTGECLSAYRFRGVKDQPPTVRVVKEFSWQKSTGLLVGLEGAEGSILCLYNLGISRVVKAVVLPGRVTAIEPITNDGGPHVSTQHLHQSLRWLFGVAAVATDVGHVLLVDLCLDDLSGSQNEVEPLYLEVATRIAAEVPQRRETVTREGRHLCFQLQNPSGTAISTLCYISRSNHLVVGFSDGCLSLWNMKTLKREHHCQLEGGRVPVYAVTFQEPENDPRNRCYLWAVQSTQESEGDVVSLHLLQLAFGDRKRSASGQVLYEGLESCDERYSLDLTGGVFPLRGPASSTKLLSCQTIEQFCNRIDKEDGVNEVPSPDTSVSIFSWQVNTSGQGKPSAYLGVFDINRWYHAQMPDSLRPEEFLHDCPYFALWSLDSIMSMTSPNFILDILVRERSLRRGVPLSNPPPPEQFFHPSNYNFDGTCLLNSGVVHMACAGFQKETWNFLKKSGPLISKAIHDCYGKHLVAGLLSPRRVDVQPSSVSPRHSLSLSSEELHERWSLCDEQPVVTQAGCKLSAHLATHRRAVPLVGRGEQSPHCPHIPASWIPYQNDCDPRVRERAAARNSVLGHYGKILPRVQRKLAAERAKPCHLPSPALREVARPKPLSTVPKQAKAGNVRTRATFISQVLSKIGEAWAGNEQQTCFSQRDRLLDLVVRPVPSCSVARGGSWQSAGRASASLMASSPLQSNMHGSISGKDSSRAPELKLLETPPVVKRAEVLATPASGFPGFIPGFILKSSLHTTPLAPPSASPGRSVTPPLRGNTEWTAGVAEGDEALSGALSEHRHGVVEDAWSESRDEPTVFTLHHPEGDGAEMEGSSESTPGDGVEKMDVSTENSQFSAGPDQTMLAYHDAKSPGDFEEDVRESQNAIFRAAKPANSSTEEAANFQELEKEEARETVEEKAFRMEEAGSSELGKAAGVFHPKTASASKFFKWLQKIKFLMRAAVKGFVRESRAERQRRTLPEDGTSVFKAAEAASFGSGSEEGETNHQESSTSSASEEKAMPAAPNPQLSESPGAVSESVTSILDREDVVPTHSESRLEGKRVHLPEERNLEAAEVEENVPSPQEEQTVSNGLAPTGEIHVIEESAAKAQASAGEYVLAPRTCARGRRSRSRSLPSAGDRPVLKTGKPVVLGLPPRRSTKRTKGASECSSLQTDANAQREQVAVTPATPRSCKRPRPANAEKAESSHTDGETVSARRPSVAITPRRGLRRTKEAASELLEEANGETSLAAGSIIASATAKRTRGGKSSAGDEESGRADSGRKTKPAVSASRSARKRTSPSLPFTENAVEDQVVQPSDRVLLPVPAKRGRRRMSSSEGSEDRDLDRCASSLPPTKF